jgi:hypothetical protein
MTIAHFLPFVFQRRGMSNSATPVIEPRFNGRIETAQPAPPKNKKEVISAGPVL